MLEIGMSGSMSGVGKRSILATAPNLDSAELFERGGVGLPSNGFELRMEGADHSFL